MQRKQHIDAFGATVLIGFSLLMALNQVVIKVTNDGFQPVFFAGLRSAGAILCIALWIRWQGRGLSIRPDLWPSALLIGTMFAIEFIFVFMALDLTSVARASVIFYTMPVWLALAGHFLLPGERLTPTKSIGLGLAVIGVSWAIFDRSGPAEEASLTGDLLALAGSLSWAGIALCARATPFREVRPELQMFYQVLISAPILLLASLFFGPLIRALEPVHLLGLTFQIVIVVSAGFVVWMWLLSVYPAANVASFSFLSPVLGVLLGWALLGETISVSILGALCCVGLGIILVNRPPRDQVPQKV
ncbi:MAG: DMT family transporter [Paracoccaceae bacterium]